MTERAARQIELIREDLACPTCEYNLRGLGGEFVTCPECGTRHDLALLIARQWAGPWQSAPGYSRILWPIVVLIVGFIPMLLIWLVAFNISNMNADNAAAVRAFIIVAAVTVMVWLGWLLSLWSYMNEGRAITLSLTAHALLGGYLVAVGGGLATVVVFLLSPSMILRLLILPLAVACILLFNFCRRQERRIAEECIRNHLRRLSNQ